MVTRSVKMRGLDIDRYRSSTNIRDYDVYEVRQISETMTGSAEVQRGRPINIRQKRDGEEAMIRLLGFFTWCS